MEQKTGFKEMFLRLVAIVGLIAVLILGAWGIILLAFNLVGLFTGAVKLDSLFSNNNQATTTPTVVVTPVNNGNTGNTGSNTNTPKPTTVTPATPSAVYTQAPRVAQLYGLADLAVTISSVNSLSSVQGRTVVQFTVTNVGTNVALSGWSFNAQLPLQPTYTYQSQGQQALYPGDSIAYTLTYDDPTYRNQYCTLQYPNYNCNYNNNYNQFQYNYSGTCYTYNGYQNIPGPCPITYDVNGNPIYANNYNQYNYPYNQNYNYYNQNYGYYPYNRTVTVTVDPQNWVPESVEYNNSASKSF